MIHMENKSIGQIFKDSFKKSFFSGLWGCLKWSFILTLISLGLFLLVFRFQPEIIKKYIKDPKDLQFYNDLRNKKGWDK
ncbi:cag pathogenicity island protein [Helicobacter pylori]|nr:cag pathogenicity island protein [Helicobacter pylori]